MSSDPINKRVALVTGSSRGIGRAIAIELARIGCDVMVNYVANEAAADETCEAAKSAGGETVRVAKCRADIAELTEHANLLETTRADFGRLDFLVNNAGIASAKRADLLEATEESFDRLIRVNLKGPYFLSQATARWMIELTDPEGHPLNAEPAAADSELDDGDQELLAR